MWQQGIGQIVMIYLINKTVRRRLKNYILKHTYESNIHSFVVLAARLAPCRHRRVNRHHPHINTVAACEGQSQGGSIAA